MNVASLLAGEAGAANTPTATNTQCFRTVLAQRPRRRLLFGPTHLTFRFYLCISDVGHKCNSIFMTNLHTTRAVRRVKEKQQQQQQEKK